MELQANNHQFFDVEHLNSKRIATLPARTPRGREQCVNGMPDKAAKTGRSMRKVCK